jgi:hypothetical protein
VVYFTDKAWSLVRERSRTRTTGPLFLTAQGRPWSSDARACQMKSIRVRFEKARKRLP